MMIRFQRDSKRTLRFIVSILFILTVPVILSSLFSCRLSVEGEPYHQGPGSRPTHLSRLEGLWFFNANNFTGRLEFYWTGNEWTGRMFFDGFNQWFEVADISFDPGSGRLQFSLPANNQLYSGTVSYNRIEGTFMFPAGTFPWKAWRK